MTHSAFKHANKSFFIRCYTRTEIISSMHSQNDQHPDNQLVKTSDSGVAIHSSLLIFLFKKQFPSLRFLPCIQCLRLLFQTIIPTQHLPTKVLGQSRALANNKPTGHGMEPRAMSLYPLPVNPTKDPTICIFCNYDP